MRQNELYHYGVLGMKWGIRRYQPYPNGHKGGKEVGDAAKKKSGFRKKVATAGAVTAGVLAGIAASKNESVRDFGSKAVKTQFKAGKDKPSESGAERLVKQSDKAISGAQSIIQASRNIQRMNNKSSSDLSGISDEELRRAINRLNLEKQYNDITFSTQTSGLDYASQILSVIGGVTTIALAGSTVASTIYKIKSGG